MIRHTQIQLCHLVLFYVFNVAAQYASATYIDYPASVAAWPGGRAAELHSARPSGNGAARELRGCVGRGVAVTFAWLLTPHRASLCTQHSARSSHPGPELCSGFSEEARCMACAACIVMRACVRLKSCRRDRPNLTPRVLPAPCGAQEDVEELRAKKGLKPRDAVAAGAEGPPESGAELSRRQGIDRLNQRRQQNMAPQQQQGGGSTNWLQCVWAQRAFCALRGAELDAVSTCERSMILNNAPPRFQGTWCMPFSCTNGGAASKASPPSRAG